MILCIDCGNSRIKWGLWSGAGWRAQGALAHGEVGQLATLTVDGPEVQKILFANVAGPALAAQIAALVAAAWPGRPLLTAASQSAAAGVRNGYRSPERLGVDRWCALLGAWARVRGTCLVVMAGTATTVDSLSADGFFPGGLILPGLELMRKSLARDTAGLPLAQGRHVAQPNCTDDAIISGCLEAQAGAIERAWRRLANPAAPCLLSGGAAGLIGPALEIPWQGVDNLVLDGLATLASEPVPPLAG